MLKKILSFVVSGTSVERIEQTIGSIEKIKRVNDVEILLTGDFDDIEIKRIRKVHREVKIVFLKDKNCFYYFKNFARRWPIFIKIGLGRLIQYKVEKRINSYDENVNAGFAMGIYLAKGKYITCLREGWVVTEDFIENTVDLMKKEKVDRLFSLVPDTIGDEPEMLSEFVQPEGYRKWDLYNMTMRYTFLNGYNNMVLIVRNRRVTERGMDECPLELFDKWAYNLFLLTESRCDRSIQQDTTICVVPEKNKKIETEDEIYDRKILYISFLQEQIWNLSTIEKEKKEYVEASLQGYKKALSLYIDSIKELSVIYGDTLLGKRLAYLYNAFEDYR